MNNNLTENINNDSQSVSMRDAFWDRLYEIAKNDKDVVLVCADMGAPSLDKFKKDLKNQFINTGIAEQNAILVAAGLALGGKKAFAYAIAPFITLRCYEQIKIELAAMNIPVTVVGVGAGLSYDDSGPTHHMLEDISILRLFPNLVVNSISDSIMAGSFADISCKMTSPNYVRLDRKVSPNIYKEGDDFSAGLSVLKKSNYVYLVATGNMVNQALEISKELQKHSIEAGVIDLYTLPINQRLFLEAVVGVEKIVTLEEHFLPGGMGSAVTEVLADNNRSIPIKRIGIDPKKGYCYKYGDRKNIQSLYGIDKESNTNTILNFLR